MLSSFGDRLQLEIERSIKMILSYSWLVQEINVFLQVLFHGEAENIAHCIKTMVEKIEKYYNKVRIVFFFAKFMIIN